VAGYLSAFLPGLGQLYAGRPGLAFLFLAPALILIGLAAAAVLSSPTRTLATLIDPTVLLILLVLQGLILLWRLMAVGSAINDPRMLPFRARDLLPTLLLLFVVVAPQLLLGYTTVIVRGASQEIFASSLRGQGEPIAPAPDWQRERINVLLLGIDSNSRRTQALTDTIIVASADPQGKSVSMLSIPRDLVDVPLPDGRVFHPKINSLVSTVERNPDAYPFAKGSGVRALAGALSTLLDVPIHYYARINLDGFVQMVDTLGGVDIRVTRALNAPSYRDYGVRGFSVRPGIHHFNGAEALAYARIRKADGENDFTRADRQQQVLVAIRDRIVKGGFLGNLTGFVGAVGQTLETDVPPDRLPFLVGLMEEIDDGRVFRAVLMPPLVREASDDRGSILIPDLPAIRLVADRLFSPVGQDPRALPSGA
jgi:polyisoprenyl-teichoic acid--peptidoglycan teichoic acid transferase